MNVRPVIGSPVHLLADEDAPAAQVHRQSASRPTPFAGRCKDVPEFADGSIHISQPPGCENEAIFRNWRGLSLDEVYGDSYLAYIQREKERKKQGQTRILPATPDFDTDMLTNSDAVAVYVQSIAAVFHDPSDTTPPSILNMLDQVAFEARHAIQDSVVDVDDATNNSATPTRSSSMSAVDVQVDAYNDENNTHDEVVTDGGWLQSGGHVDEASLNGVEPHPFLSGDALALSLALVDVLSQHRRSVELLLERVVQIPAAACTVPNYAVECALDSLEQAVAERRARTTAPETVAQLSGLVHQCELVGAVICARHLLAETLRFVNLLESLGHLDGGASPVPSMSRLMEMRVQTAYDECSDALRQSPFHGYEDPPRAVDLPINSRTRTEHICVSPDRKQLTVVTATGLSTFSLAAAKASLSHSSDFPASASGTGTAAPWCSVYSSDNRFLVLTNEHGTVHTVYDAAGLVQHSQIITDSMRVPLDYKDGVLLTMPAPFLPSCSRSSLLLYQDAGAAALVSKQMKEIVAGDMLVTSCLLGYDFEGTFLSIRTDITVLTLTLSKNVLTVTDGTTRCYAALPQLRKWCKLVVQWREYVPHVTVNGHSLHLKGAHTVRRRAVQVHSVDCCDGSCHGHIADVSVSVHGWQQWTGPNTVHAGAPTATFASRSGTDAGSTTSRVGVAGAAAGTNYHTRSTFAASPATRGPSRQHGTGRSAAPTTASPSKPSEACVLFHLPLDEGTGLWVKDLSAGRGCSLMFGRIQWDHSLTVPQRLCASDGGTACEIPRKGRGRPFGVRIEEEKLLQSRVVVSNQHVYFMWPPKSIADDGLVVQVWRSTGVIQEVYHCAGVGRDACTTLLPDESGYYVLQHPLNTATFVGLSVPSARYLEFFHTAAELLRTESSAVTGTTTTESADDPLPTTGTHHRDPNSASTRPSSKTSLTNTTGGFLRALSMHLYSWAPVLESSQIPVTAVTTSASLTELVRLMNTDPGPTAAYPLRPAFLVALATVHVRALPQQDVSAVAASLTSYAQQYTERWRAVPALRRSAEALTTATTLKCVLVRDLVAALFRLEEPSQQRLLASCVSHRNVAPLMRFLVEEESDDRVCAVVHSLFAMEQLAAAKAGPQLASIGPPAVSSDDLTMFSCGPRGLITVLTAIVSALQDAGRQATIGRLLSQRIDCAVRLFTGPAAALNESGSAYDTTPSQDASGRGEGPFKDGIQLTERMMTNGVIPLLIVVRQTCPLVVGSDPRIKEGLLRLLHLTNDGALAPKAENGRAPEVAEIDHVHFSFREMVEVVPTNERADAAWRVEMDYHGASSIALLKATSSGAMTAMHVPLHARESRRFDMAAGEGFTPIDGDVLVLFGKGPTSFSVIAAFDLLIPRRIHVLLREALVATLLTYAKALVRNDSQPASLGTESQPRPRDIYVPAMMRSGLSTETLARHDINLPGRTEHLPIAEEILNDTGEGKLLVDYAFSLMRASILPSMRPAVCALLCLLVVSGANTHQAAEELKHLWFSGEWGTKLQGVTREHTTRQLTELALWMTRSMYYNSDAAAETFRRTSMTERRMETSLNESRSISEARNSASVTSRRGTVHYADTLEQVHTLLVNGITTAELEEALVQRTRLALRNIESMELILSVVSIPYVDAPIVTVNPVVDTLIDLSDNTFQMHKEDTLSGAGYDLVHQLRVTHHSLLGKCQQALLTWQEQQGSSGPDIGYAGSLGAVPFGTRSAAPVPLLEAAPQGRLTLSLFALLCYPWDLDDCDLFAKNLAHAGSILRQLEKPLSTLTHRLIDYSSTTSTATTAAASPFGEADDGTGAADGGEFGAPTVVDVITKMTKCSECNPLAAIDLASLTRAYPNGFSVVIPQVQTSTSKEGTVMKKSSPKTTVICADKEWPLAWRDGLPSLFYFEVRLQSAPTETAIGLALNSRQKELTVFYTDAGETHEAPLPPFHQGDVVGCGVLPVSGLVLLTLNGRLLFLGTVPKKTRVVLPAVRLGQASQVIVNFGTAPFAFDGRYLHPALDRERGPTQYMVSTMAGVTLHCMTARACLAHEVRRDGGSASTLRHYCCVVVCDAVKKVTMSLLEMNNPPANGAPTPASQQRRRSVDQLVAFAAAEHLVVLLIATIRRLVNGSSRVLSAFTQNESERLFETVSLLMLLPLHSIQVATLSLLAEVVQCVQTVKDSAAQHLVNVLFDYAMATHNEAESTAMVPFVPRWTDCDTRFMSITSSKTATMLPEAQRSAVIGAPLPRTGTVSFSVRITRNNMHKGHSLKGGYFIGVAVAGLTPLSPSSNSQSWKSVKPPVVWALHDISPQLAYATNPTVKPNNFQRTFGHADVVCVVVDRDRGTVDFFRENEYLTRLFSDVPNDVDIVPFAQLYNDDAEAHLIDGEMTAPLTAATLLSSVSVDVLRCMLTLEPFETLVARRLCEEMDRSSFPRVSLMVFNSLPDPRLLRLPSSLIESATEIKVTRLVGLECKYNLDGEAHFEYLHNMRRASHLQISCSIAADVNSGNASLQGLRMCVSKLVGAARQIAVPLITTQALCYLEGEARQGIMDEEREHWAFLFHGVRVNSFKSVRDEVTRNTALGRTVLEPPGFERAYVFSPSLSHPGFCFSRHSRYQLATVPSENKNMTAPYIAIAEPAIPSSGTFSIRCQLMRGSSGQILGGGYYFGVCTNALTWAGKDLCSTTINVWAIHDMEDTPWRLRHLLPSATFPVVVEPRCIIVSGDIIRLEVNRTAGTMFAFRKPVGAAEVPLGQIYDNLPAGPLYPFVHLFNTDAVAVLLPPNTEEPAVRLAVPKPVYSVIDARTRRFCDGCYALHHECKLTDTWYKCNVCADYSLCKTCYSLFVHSKHTFTQMGDGCMVHSRRAPREFAVGMPVVVSTSPCVYLRSAACRLEEDDLWTTAQAVDENALVLWGLTRPTRVQFSITIESTDGEPLGVDSPTFVGVGIADEVLPLTRKNMRAWCHNLTTEKVCFSNDPTLHSAMHRESRSPYGFQSGDTISFEVNLAKSTVTVFRNWVALGTCHMQARRTSGSGLLPLACFVAFGRPNMKATLFSEGPATTVARIEDIKAYIVRAVTRTGECVVAAKENCRLPLMPFSDFLPMMEKQRRKLPADRAQWPLGYTFVNNQMTQARLENVESPEMVHVNVLATEETIVVPAQCFLVNESGSLVLDSLVHSGMTRTVGPSMKSCFVLSRYLLILSCLCESDTLSPLVTSLGSDIIGILKGLASVQITKDAATDFLTDIRNTVALTAGWASYRGSEVWKTSFGGSPSGSSVWGVNGDVANSMNGVMERLTFVPTLGTEERRRRYRQGLLVHILEGGDGQDGSGQSSSPRTRSLLRNTVYRVLERRGDMLSLSRVVDGEVVECNFRQCVPLKQCAGQAWYLESNSVPCSLLEHSTRVSSLSAPHGTARVLTLEGIWEGTATITEGRTVSFRINLLNHWFGEALFNFSSNSSSGAPDDGDDVLSTMPGKTPTTALRAVYQHHRLERTVTIYIVPLDVAEAILDTTPLHDLSHYEAAAMAIRDFCERDTTDEGSSQLVVLRGTLDYDGIRMDGMYKKSDEQPAPFHAKLRQHIPLVAATTRERHVEPLPSCTDAVLTPPRHRDAPEVLHRLIVLLAHHLYLVLCSHLYVSWHELESALLLNDHPLTRQLVGNAIGVPQLLQLVTDAANLIFAPKVKAWEAATLARLLTESFLLRADVLDVSPRALVWDALHAVVAAAHQCGDYCRHDLVTHVTTFLRRHEEQVSPSVLRQLLALLVGQLNSCATCPSAFVEASRDNSALMELVLASPPLIQSTLQNRSLDPLKCLVAMWQALSDGTPLPKAVECSSGNELVADGPVQTECVFGDYEGDVLKVGKVVSGVSAPANTRSYYEVVLPEHVPSQFSVGWGTLQHKEVPSQHVGSDAASFGFNGTDILSPKGRQEYRISSEPGTAMVIGCLLDLTEHTVAWSMNGYQGPHVPIPISLKGNVLFAFVSIGACKGMAIRMRAEQFEYDPDGYTDLCGRHSRPLIRNFDPRETSALPVQPIAFYWQLANYLSDAEDEKPPQLPFDREASMVSNNVSACTPTRSTSITSLAPKYPLVRLMSVFEISDYTHVIQTLESCMTTASHYVDLDGDTITGQLSQSFVFLKRFVRRQFRQKLVSMHMQYPEKRQPPTAVTISLTELYSTLPRSPEVALQHTVLAQLHRQIGLLSDGQWMSTPLFLVHLFTTESGQAPTDAGGPYRQVWTCLADEIMTHPDRCFPHTEFHRNPLFVFVNNSQRLTLVPDTYASSQYELTLFQFFGKLMGYAARSKTPCAVDLSPFLWKFLVDDTLSIRDYYTHVNSVVEKSIEDDDFLSSGVAEDVIPGFVDHIEWPKEDGLGSEAVMAARRKTAEECLIHSMDKQLRAIQTGLWSTLPRRVARCLSWSELETLVCGTADPSMSELRQCIRLQLTGPRQKYFWQILSEMTSEQKSNLLCFASGQKRLPLIRLITVSETNESIDHLPRAQSCFSIITLPKYSSYEMFKEKLLLALSHQTEMDLA